jgi:hypothetical protein
MPKISRSSGSTSIRRWRGAEDKEPAQSASKAVAKAYGVKFPKAVEKITRDERELLAFFD